MDLLERARTLAACPLFESLAPAVLVRLAERARPIVLARGERRTTDDTVWVVAAGTVRVGSAPACVGNAIGIIRVVRPETPAAAIVADEPAALVALAVDDVRDVLEEDPAALAALAGRLAALLLDVDEGAGAS
jgi:hypothetical protein